MSDGHDEAINDYWYQQIMNLAIVIVVIVNFKIKNKRLFCNWISSKLSLKAARHEPTSEPLH